MYGVSRTTKSIRLYFTGISLKSHLPIDAIRNPRASKPSEYRLTMSWTIPPRIFPDMYPAPRAAKIELIPVKVVLVC
jgi:hypothetical protein